MKKLVLMGVLFALSGNEFAFASATKTELSKARVATVVLKDVKATFTREALHDLLADKRAEFAAWLEDHKMAVKIAGGGAALLCLWYASTYFRALPKPAIAHSFEQDKPRFACEKTATWHWPFNWLQFDPWQNPRLRHVSQGTVGGLDNVRATNEDGTDTSCSAGVDYNLSATKDEHIASVDTKGSLYGVNKDTGYVTTKGSKPLVKHGLFWDSCPLAGQQFVCQGGSYKLQEKPLTASQFSAGDELEYHPYDASSCSDGAVVTIVGCNDSHAAKATLTQQGCTGDSCTLDVLLRNQGS